MLNRKKLYRLYREERLTVRKRGGRKRALGTRAPMAIPQGRNQRWSLDFVSDTLASGRTFRMLTWSMTSAGNAWPGRGQLALRHPCCPRTGSGR